MRRAGVARFSWLAVLVCWASTGVDGDSCTLLFHYGSKLIVEATVIIRNGLTPMGMTPGCSGLFGSMVEVQKMALSPDVESVELKLGNAKQVTGEASLLNLLGDLPTQYHTAIEDVAFFSFQTNPMIQNLMLQNLKQLITLARPVKDFPLLSAVNEDKLGACLVHIAVCDLEQSKRQWNWYYEDIYQKWKSDDIKRKVNANMNGGRSKRESSLLDDLQHRGIKDALRSVSMASAVQSKRSRRSSSQSKSSAPRVTYHIQALFPKVGSCGSDLGHLPEWLDGSPTEVHVAEETVGPEGAVNWKHHKTNFEAANERVWRQLDVRSNIKIMGQRKYIGRSLRVRLVIGSQEDLLTYLTGQL